MLTKEGYNVEAASSGGQALGILGRKSFDVVLTDLIMPGISGITLLEEIKSRSPDTQVILITAFATIENAVEAMKKGAAEYVTKPFKINEVQITIRKVLEEAKIREKESLDPLIKILSADDLIKSISNSSRRNILLLLASRGEWRFSDIKKGLSIDLAPKLSFHLKVLRDAGLIEQDKKKNYYLTPAGKNVAKALKNVAHINSLNYKIKN